MKVQVQTKPLERGLIGDDGFEVWFEGYRIPKQEREWIAEMRRENTHEVRVVYEGSSKFIR